MAYCMYFQGLQLDNVIELINLPTADPVAPRAEDEDSAENVTVLHPILDAFDQLIEETRATFAEGRINIFDQHRVNSFLRGRPFRRPIFTKLLDGTYKSYKRVWKQLLCYVIRVAHFHAGPRLHFQMTQSQILALDRLIAAASSLSANVDTADVGEEAISCAQEQLRRCCLEFCISLLDHQLREISTTAW